MKNILRKLAVLFLMVMVFTSCTDKKGTQGALEVNGYHPISVGGWAPFCCGRSKGSDMFATEFTAYSPDSTRIVKGCVCKGVFKGATIRIKKVID